MYGNLRTKIQLVDISKMAANVDSVQKFFKKSRFDQIENFLRRGLFVDVYFEIRK